MKVSFLPLNCLDIHYRLQFKLHNKSLNKKIINWSL